MQVKDTLLDKLFYSWWTELVVIKESIQRIIKWLPILWHDRDWDHYHIWNILENKIRFTKENIHKYGHHVNKSRDVNNMRIAEILIDRIKKDEYEEMTNKEHTDHWGELEWIEDSEDDNILFDNKFSKHGLVRTKVNSQQEWEQECKESTKRLKHAEYLKQQDMEYLFRHLKKHIHKWWN